FAEPNVGARPQRANASTGSSSLAEAAGAVSPLAVIELRLLPALGGATEDELPFVYHGHFGPGDGGQVQARNERNQSQAKHGTQAIFEVTRIGRTRTAWQITPHRCLPAARRSSLLPRRAGAGRHK